MADISKIVIRIDGFGEPTLLMSRKKAKGTDKHGLLELLGGGTDGQDPLPGLIRELEEEEKTGRLAELVRAQPPTPRVARLDGDAHYLFELSIAFADYVELRHAKGESMGFKAVPEAQLQDLYRAGLLTKRTQGLLGALGLIR